MKKIALAVAVALGAMSQPMALAGTTTGTLSVSATLTGVCTSVSAPPLNFGSVPVLPTGTGGNVFYSGSTALTVSCTPSTFYSIDLDLGLHNISSSRQMVDLSGTNIPYFLNQDAFGALPWGTLALGTPLTATMGGTGSATHTIYGQMALRDGLSPGTYSDTVTITVTY